MTYHSVVINTSRSNNLEEAMKIDLPAIKPRAKWLNDILVSKRSERHADTRKQSRSQLKQSMKKELQSR